MKLISLILGLASYILIVNNTHLINLHGLYKGDSYEYVQAAISIGACVLFVVIQKLFKSSAGLNYFRGVNLTHVAVFLLTSYISLTLLPIRLDFVFLIVTVLVLAIIEQYIVFVQIARYYGTKKFLFVLVVVYLIFMFGHDFNFSIAIIVSTLILMPTLYRTIVDRNIWHGVIFHYTYNVAVISGLDRIRVGDTVLFTWFILILIYWVLLIFTADNARPAAAKMLSRVFRGNIGANIAALLTIICRGPMLLLKGIRHPYLEFVRTRNSIKFQADARAQKAPSAG
jgi:hypothetical protein